MVQPALVALDAELGACDVELLAYGSGADGLADGSPERTPSAAGPSRVIGLPSLAGGPPAVARSLLAFLLEVRRHRYEAVLVAQPGLRISRARGLLLAFPHLTRSRRVLALESPAATPVEVGRAEAFADLARWLLIQVWCSLLAAVAARLVGAINRRSSPRAPRGSGRVVYMRTDLELAGTRLAAGGSLAHTLGIVGALRTRGYDVDVWSTGEIEGLATRPLPAVVRPNWPTEVAELVSGLRQALAGWRARPASAFVYQRYSLNNLAGLLLARRWRVPLILEANASEVQWRREWSSLRYARLSAACERLLLRGADRVLVVSDNARAHLIDADADSARLRTIPNGVDVERFAGATPHDLGLDEGAFAIAFCGLFYRWHGVATLAEAFVLLRERHPQARLLLVGEGEEEARVRAILGRAGALGDCLLPGLVPREAVPAYLAAADALVSPHADLRNFIGSPIKIFEYMASGRPIVASRLAQLAEILAHERTALLVEPGDPAALAQALERLIEDPGLARRLGEQAQAQARAAHSWDARVAAILADDWEDGVGAGEGGALSRGAPSGGTPSVAAPETPSPSSRPTESPHTGR